MPDLLLKTIQPFVIGIMFALLYLAEHLFPQQDQRGNAVHDIKNILFGLMNTAITFIGGYYFQRIIQWLNHRQLGLFNIISLPLWLTLLLQILFLDIFMYWWHRLNHQASFFWRFHRFHHVDPGMNSTTALRFHSIELILSYFARLLIFPLFGFSFTAILLYSLLFFPVVLLHHSNVAIREGLDLIMRRFIVTPRMHRIHHSNKIEETNSNYSSVFPWWDRLFNSYRRKPAKEITFGVESF